MALHSNLHGLWRTRRGRPRVREESSEGETQTVPRSRDRAEPTESSSPQPLEDPKSIPFEGPADVTARLEERGFRPLLHPYLGVTPPTPLACACDHPLVCGLAPKGGKIKL